MVVATYNQENNNYNIHTQPPPNYGAANMYINNNVPSQYISQNIIQNNNEDCVYLYKMSRSIKIISIIDFIFIFLYIFISWPLAFLSILPLCGYFGAKKYNSNLVNFYIIFNVLNILGKIYQVYYGIKYGFIINTLIGLIGLALSIYIIKLCINFNNKIKQLSIDNYNALNMLRNNWYPNQSVFQTV